MHADMNSVMLVPASWSDPRTFRLEIEKESPGDEVSRLVAQANRTIARLRYLTTTTRIHFVFALLFKFANSAEDKRTIALICTRKQHTQGFW